jgi:hypothetical protein
VSARWWWYVCSATCAPADVLMLQGKGSAAAPTSSKASVPTATTSSKKPAKKAAKSAKKQAKAATAAGQVALAPGTRALLQRRARHWAEMLLDLAPRCVELQAALLSKDRLLDWLKVCNASVHKCKPHVFYAALLRAAVHDLYRVGFRCAVGYASP